ncbi:MAG: toxin-antitoxin system YwqK family antitoxin [Salibacteraceae bacterium]
MKREPFSFYESGKPKEYNLYSFIDGRKTLVGYEEVYENGVIKITGKVDSNTQRVGLWESFYEDGKPWSIGEYENGVEIGRKKTWYSNGKPRYEGLMLNGKPSGTWFFWDEKGVKTTKAYK